MGVRFPIGLGDLPKVGNPFGKINMNQMKTAALAGLAVTCTSSAAFIGYTVVETDVTHSGYALTRFELFANFNAATDTVLNVYNFSAYGGWAGHANLGSGFWHKDDSNSSAAGVLSQTSGSWAPQLTGNATTNRPFDSFLLIGGHAVASNSTTADPSWVGGGANPNGWNQAQLPLYNDLGWFNAFPPNMQGAVGSDPNSATTVKLGQFMLSQSDHADRKYTLRIAINNGLGTAVVASDGTFHLPAPGAIALLGLAGLKTRRRR
ncbi:MAG: hypothetical protein DWI10_07540 [Planctomycetota bacterium]|nr:MAG: hypothetical protein DWI10_07540 [Planctomycetota bacterium]